MSRSSAVLSGLRRHCTVRLRLFALLLLSSALLVGLGQRLLGGLQQLGGAVQTLAKHELPSVLDLGKLRAAFLRAQLAERSLLFQSMATETAKATVASHAAALGAAAAAWRTFTADAPELAASCGFRDTFAAWSKTSLEVLEILREDTPAARRDAVDLSMGLSQEQAAAVDHELDAATRACGESATACSSAAVATATSQQQHFWRWLAIGLGVLFALGFVIVHSVVAPLRRTARALQACASGNGDLSQRLHEPSGEIGDLARAFNEFVDGLARLVTGMRTTASEVQTAAVQVGEVGASLGASAGTVEQAIATAGNAAVQVRDVTTDAASSTRELASSIQDIAGNATRLTATAQEVGQAASATHGTVATMGRDSERVQRVVGVIADIARQTNLLALNASVEAARAGESGAGFAVVAERVKTLSIESAKATAEIRQHIDAFLDSVQRAIPAIAGIKNATVQFGTSTSSIAAAVEQQSAVTHAFAESFATIQSAGASIANQLQGIEGAARTTSQGAATARQAATRLVAASGRLAELVGNFRL